MASTEQSKKDRIYKRKRLRRQFTGAVFALLAGIGVVSIVLFGINQVRKTFDDTDDRQAYAALIAPIVALDPAPFKSLDQADPNLLMQGAIWATILNEDVSKYSRDEQSGQLMLPSIEVASYAAKLYGPDIAVENKTFTSSGITFTYISETGMYLIPATSLSGSYVPFVESITTSGNTKVLHVAYTTTTSSEMIANPNTMIINKYMDYIFIKNGSEYYLYAIHEPEK